MDVFDELVRMRRERRACALATIINVQGSIPSFAAAKMLVRDDGTIAGTIGGGLVEAEVRDAAREVIASERPRTMTFNLADDPKYDGGLVCGGALEVFVEPIVPSPTVYLFGAGHVNQKVNEIARTAGFETHVVDPRAIYANAGRFPGARITLSDFSKIGTEVSPTSFDFIVIATPGHRDDAHVLRWAVGTSARYVGMIGSRRKVLTVFRSLEQQGVACESLVRVRAPIGLDIAAVTPEEIGVSIVAEIIAVRRGAAAPSMSIAAAT